jgi:hypothetical protein
VTWKTAAASRADHLALGHAASPRGAPRRPDLDRLPTRRAALPDRPRRLLGRAAADLRVITNDRASPEYDSIMRVVPQAGGDRPYAADRRRFWTARIADPCSRPQRSGRARPDHDDAASRHREPGARRRVAATATSRSGSESAGLTGSVFKLRTSAGRLVPGFAATSGT